MPKENFPTTGGDILAVSFYHEFRLGPIKTEFSLKYSVTDRGQRISLENHTHAYGFGIKSTLETNPENGDFSTSHEFTTIFTPDKNVAVPVVPGKMNIEFNPETDKSFFTNLGQTIDDFMKSCFYGYFHPRHSSE